MPAESRSGGRWKIWSAAWAVLLVLGALGTAYDILYRYPNAPGPGIGQTMKVEIPQGVGPEKLSRILDEKGIISSPGRFRLWLRVTDRLPGVKAGLFVLRDNMPPAKILSVISGRPDNRGVRVTIPEGFTLGQIAKALEDSGIAAQENFFVAVGKGKSLDRLGIPGPSAEGFLFPDTYFFDRGTPTEDIVMAMHETFLKRWRSLDPPAGMDLLGLVTLASIVQAEAKIVDEMPIIAGVYRNRLTDPTFPSRLLQADPTVAYGCEPGVVPRAPSCAGFIGNLARKQLEDPKNPYNTYRHAGLPPGPICAPGIDALEAALHPKDVPYLYFVARKDGRHRFSKTLLEHTEAVRLYREGL
jgi:UPF0755 protein